MKCNSSRDSKQSKRYQAERPTQSSGMGNKLCARPPCASARDPPIKCHKSPVNKGQQPASHCGDASTRVRPLLQQCRKGIYPGKQPFWQTAIPTNPGRSTSTAGNPHRQGVGLLKLQLRTELHYIAAVCDTTILCGCAREPKLKLKVERLWSESESIERRREQSIN